MRSPISGRSPPVGDSEGLLSTSDDDLLPRCRNGDEGAWHELVSLHTRRVFSLAYRFTGRVDEAEDLTQEIFIKVYRTLDRYHEANGPFPGWLMTVARNHAIDHYRRRKQEMLRRTEDPQVLESGDTIYLTVADARGNMVSLIQSNYSGMGSGMTPPGLGFILQNRGELFSLEKGHPNAFAPGKRPFHTIIPAFVTRDGKPWLSFGVMGGAMQPQGHAQVLVNIIDFGMNLQQAGDAPRIRHDGSTEPTGGSLTNGGVVRMESGFSQETWRELERRGHTLSKAEGGYGGYQAIGRDPKSGVYIGASESRKDGQAAGY